MCIRDSPNTQDHKTLVLDLDETLVHTSTKPILHYDVRFAYSDTRRRNYLTYVKLRPHLKEFLEEVKGRYEVVIYTATEPFYADRIINRIEYGGKCFAYRVYRRQCVNVKGNLYKPLEFLCVNRKIKDIVIVDNTVQSFALNLANGIPIKAFLGEEDDTELLKLAKYLKELSCEKDVRERIMSDLLAYTSKE
eukprot:TRINITY_DN6575_c0_g1_i4.p1 TRINITY_DN6575_c0_g1~~TRINITY_DN6575_c0_g1_i4.p1  ORF type:complete len:192 (+),score=32.30 TRINITY_DN6575_c0_g1_i4:73-648(+)